MKIYNNPSKTEWGEIVKRPVFENDEIEARVKPVLQKVKEYGDIALREFTLTFDKVEINDLEVSEAEKAEASSQITEELKQSIDLARANIEKFHQSQRSTFEVIETAPGVKCWQKSVPIQKVGLYVPGGTAPLFSTVLMLAIPAVIAGCEEIILCSPPNKKGKIHPAIIYAASLVGVTNIYKVGGAQAIAALGYGTESIPQTYKIFGPGNQYVTAAKQLLSKEGIAIDLPAGPSEVLVVADKSTNLEFAAADLLSQAEHGVDSQVILIANDMDVLYDIQSTMKKQLAELPRKEIAEKAIENSKAIVFENFNESIDFINEYAPEHLIISTNNFEEYSANIINAGSVFLGHYTPESAGDYASGTNHTLPTNGYAKAFSGVNLDSFVKKITFQHISREGLKNIGNAIEVMAENEELNAHKNAVSLRLKNID
jgi:histidinol dehydrogenase